MRFHLRDKEIPLRVARRLRDMLDNDRFGLSRCQGLVAQMFGYRDLHDLQACLDQNGRHGPSDYAFGLTAHDIVRRRERQAMVLVKAGIAPWTAFAVVRRLRPTADAGKFDFEREERAIEEMVTVPWPWYLDYAGAGFTPSPAWTAALGEGSGLLIVGGATGVGKSTLAFATMRETKARFPKAKVVAVPHLRPTNRHALFHAMRNGCLVVAAAYGEDLGEVYVNLAATGVDADDLREHLLGIVCVSSKRSETARPGRNRVPFDGGVHPDDAGTVTMRTIAEEVYRPCSTGSRIVARTAEGTPFERMYAEHGWRQRDSMLDSVMFW